MRTYSRYLRPAIALLCLLALLACTVEAFAAASYPYATVTTDQVNLRRKASTRSTLMGRLEKDTPVIVTGKSGSFSAVVVNGRSGYVLSSCLAPYDPALNTADSYPYETVTTAAGNLLKKNDKKSAVLARVGLEEEVTVLGETNSYAHVRWNGTEGYLRKTGVLMKTVTRKTRAAATPTPVPTLAPGEDSVNYVTLRSGSTGNDVTALQNALIELGFLDGEADGSFGLSTQAAVGAFQQANSFPITGEADANLQAFLFSGSPRNAKGAKTTVKTLPNVEGIAIRPGNTGILANGLTADGVAGPSTQALLFSGDAVAAGATAAPTQAPTPTPAPALTRPAGTVARGTSGADARLVQKRLKDLGYYTGTVDGKFGSASVSALKAFQTANGLKADGVAGASTCSVLFSWDARPAGAAPTPVILATFAPDPTPDPTPTPTPTPITQANVVTVRLGTSGPEVLRLQERLTQLGYYDATTDGVCKADDAAAIRLFQERNGLKADGVAGYATQVRLYAEDAVPYVSAAVPVSADTSATLRLGMTGSAVKQMQQRLKDLGYFSGTPDGKFGTATANALISFQGNNKLTRDGVAGPKTLQKLYGSSAVAAKAAATPTPKASAKATPTPAPAASGVLKLGDTSSAVKDMQQRLIELGYLRGRADGKFGNQTQQALLAFQRANRLTADGIAGSRTLASLNSDGAINASGNPAVTPAPTPVPTAAADARPRASQVKYENWYTTIRAIAKKYPYATVYDYSTGISWQVHIFSCGAHADVEPLTANDTARMERAFGGNTWNPKAVWVVFGNGEVYMASTHSMPHEVQHRTGNNFNGHCCIHFPRTNAQVSAIGPYATSHQAAIDAGWLVTQSMK